MTEQRIIAIDSQILDAIQKCGFYTYLNFIKNYRPNEVIVPLERGDLGHTMLETYYKCLKANVSWEQAVEESIKDGREKYQELKIDFQLAEYTIQVFNQYVSYYKYDGMIIHGVEEPFSIVLHESDELIVLYQGKIDLHFSLPNLPKSLMDHKWRMMKAEYGSLDNQLIGYAIKEDTPIVYVNEVGMQKSYEPEKKFRRVPVNIGDGVKKRWISNTVTWAKILDFNIQNNVWPQSHLKVPPAGTSQCTKCQYYKICASENDQEMERKIQDYFHIGKQWDVGNKLEDNPGEN